MASQRKPGRKPRKTGADEARRRNGSKGGRPREDGLAGIPWSQVRRYARLGGDRDTIVTALGFPAQLRKPEVVLRLQQELDRGAALLKLDLLAGVNTLREEGSVNATLASLKEQAGWSSRDGKPGEALPDDEAAVAELQTVLKRFGPSCN